MTLRAPIQPAVFPYAEVFSAVEKHVLASSSERVSPEQVKSRLDEFKHVATRSFSDADYFRMLVFVAFYSGFKAETVSRKRTVIEECFPTWEVVAEYDEEDIRGILHRKNMIANKRKIRACVNNARTLRNIVHQHGSFKAFLDHHLRSDSFEDLMLLKELLQTRFDYLGGITVYHFMTDVGLNVLKPDLVISRLFKRLGLLESEEQPLKAIIEGRKFAAATRLPIRYIDIVLVTYGQVASSDLGSVKGMCLKEPRCSACSIRSYCRYESEGSSTAELV